MAVSYSSGTCDYLGLEADDDAEECVCEACRAIDEKEGIPEHDDHDMER